ncbi:MAG: oligosaccharide flippase family protein [Pyrinomonadaceae bacterium]
MYKSVKSQSLLEQGAWLFVAKIIGFAFSFFLPLLVVRYLSQDSVGLYRQSFQVISNAVVILPIGFSMSAYYFLARETARRSAAILNILIFNFIAGGVACAALNLWPQSVGQIFQSEEMTRLVPIIGFVIWTWIFSTFLETVAIANQETRAATLFIVGASFSKTVLMAGAVLIFATVEAFLYAAIIQGLIQTLILLYYLNSRFPGFWQSFDRAFFREQMVYAIPFGLTGILWIAQTDIHSYFVAHKFSDAEFAIYALGCFELPLLAMLAESVNSVLIPRMNELQSVGDREGIFRLTARAMQKLSFIYFPVYVFLLITAHTFIVTLFTESYAASASIFVINLTLLPFNILITDPIVRSFKELGKLFLLTRVLILTCLTMVLYFGLENFGLIGMITASVSALLIEKCIALAMVIRKLGVGWQHLPLVKNVATTAALSGFAGIITYIIYANGKEFIFGLGHGFVRDAFATTSSGIANFAGGTLVLLVCGAVFTPIYLLAANFCGVIEDEEKAAVRDLLSRIVPRKSGQPLTDNQT